MNKTEKPILEVLAGKKPARVPLWFMRQAGRYLPEYRALRAEAKNFLHFCLTPALATEATLQPIKRFDLDAAILFADILLIPHALGQKLEFKEGEGPALEPLTDDKSIAGMKFDISKLLPVFETVSKVKPALPQKTALIGFCGGPWTVAAYMIDGTSRNQFSHAKSWAENRPESLDRLLATLIEASADYLCGQIDAGVEIIQIFESWAGLLQGEDFKRFVIKPTKELIGRVRQKHPGIPVIGFPREAGAQYRDYALETGVDCMSIDQHVGLDQARELQKLKLLQGNLDPLLLAKGGEEMRRAAEAILEKLGPSHIFNLGHGVIPETPPENVARLVEIAHGRKA